MGARRLTSKVSHIHISAVRLCGGGVGVGVVFRARDGTNVRKTACALQAGSPEEATYEAVIAAVDYAAHIGARSLTVYLDSPQVVDELNRRAKVSPALRALFVQARCRANALNRIRFRLSRKSENFAARRLAKASALGSQPLEIEYEDRHLPLLLGDDAALRG